MTKRQTHLGASAKDLKSAATKGLKDPKSLTAKEVKSLAAAALTQAQAEKATASVAPVKTSLRGKAPAAKTPGIKVSTRTSRATAFSALAMSESTRAIRAQSPAKAFSFRIDEGTIGLIDQAAKVTGQTRTEFVLASARKQATDVLLDQTLFRLSNADWEAFSRALDEPAAPNDELKLFLARKSPWEE